MQQTWRAVGQSLRGDACRILIIKSQVLFAAMPAADRTLASGRAIFEHSALTVPVTREVMKLIRAKNAGYIESHS